MIAALTLPLGWWMVPTLITIIVFYWVFLSGRVPNPAMKASYRLRYYWRKVCHFFGRCPKCGASVSFTRSGQPICHNCKQR